MSYLPEGKLDPGQLKQDDCVYVATAISNARQDVGSCFSFLSADWLFFRKNQQAISQWTDGTNH